MVPPVVAERTPPEVAAVPPLLTEPVLDRATRPTVPVEPPDVPARRPSESANERIERVTSCRCCSKLARCTGRSERERLVLKNCLPVPLSDEAARSVDRLTTLPRLCDSGTTGICPRMTVARRSSLARRL